MPHPRISVEPIRLLGQNFLEVATHPDNRGELSSCDGLLSFAVRTVRCAIVRVLAMPPPSSASPVSRTQRLASHSCPPSATTAGGREVASRAPPGATMPERHRTTATTATYMFCNFSFISHYSQLVAAKICTAQNVCLRTPLYKGSFQGNRSAPAAYCCLDKHSACHSR